MTRDSQLFFQSFPCGLCRLALQRIFFCFLLPVFTFLQFFRELYYPKINHTLRLCLDDDFLWLTKFSVLYLMCSSKFLFRQIIVLCLCLRRTRCTDNNELKIASLYELSLEIRTLREDTSIKIYRWSNLFHYFHNDPFIKGIDRAICLFHYGDPLQQHFSFHFS